MILLTQDLSCLSDPCVWWSLTLCSSIVSKTVSCRFKVEVSRGPNICLEPGMVEGEGRVKQQQLPRAASYCLAVSLQAAHCIVPTMSSQQQTMHLAGLPHHTTSYHITSHHTPTTQESRNISCGACYYGFILLSDRTLEKIHLTIYKVKRSHAMPWQG